MVCRGDVRCPQESIVNTLCFVADVGDDAVIPAGICVSRGHVALWGSAIPVAPPRCDEGGVVAILDVEGDRVVPIPSVEDCLAMVGWDGAGLMKRGLCVVLDAWQFRA